MRVSDFSASVESTRGYCHDVNNEVFDSSGNHCQSYSTVIYIFLFTTVYSDIFAIFSITLSHCSFIFFFPNQFAFPWTKLCNLMTNPSSFQTTYEALQIIHAIPVEEFGLFFFWSWTHLCRVNLTIIFATASAFAVAGGGKKLATSSHFLPQLAFSFPAPVCIMDFFECCLTDALLFHHQSSSTFLMRTHRTPMPIGYHFPKEYS